MTLPGMEPFVYPVHENECVFFMRRPRFTMMSGTDGMVIARNPFEVDYFVGVVSEQGMLLKKIMTAEGRIVGEEFVTET